MKKVFYSKSYEINRYYNDESLSQSRLKRLLVSPVDFLNNKPIESTEAMEIGSLVDLMITGEPGAFYNQYYMTSFTLPTGTKKNIVRKIYEDVKKFTDLNKLDIYDLSNYKSRIEILLEESSWQMNWKLETRINKIIKEGLAYFEELKLSDGKTIISKKIKIKVDKLVDIIENQGHCASYFNKENNTEENKELYFQLPIYFKFQDILCKALPDLITIEYKDSKISKIHIIDLKLTSDSVLNFDVKIRKFRYDIQSAWYIEAVKQHFKDKISSDTNISFSFVVKCIYDDNQPIEVVPSEELIKIGKQGKKSISLENRIISKEIKGISQLIDDYIYYESHGYNEEKNLKKNKNKLTVDWDGYNL